VLNRAEGAQAQTRRGDACASLNPELVGVRALLAAADLATRRGARVAVTARDRARYREHGREEPCAAVFMDPQMPVIYGLAATRLLRANPHCEQLPLIAMTANAMKAELDACLAA